MFSDLMSPEFAVNYLAAQGFILPRDVSRAHDWCVTEAKLGVVEAQCVTSTLYWSGITNRHDVTQAIEWCERAASAGSDDARRAMAGHLISGMGIEQNASRGIEILKELANSGHLPSMLSLALLMLSGENDMVRYDPKVAVELLVDPAEAGSPLAQCLLGSELARNPDLAIRRAGVKWITTAANNGSGTAHRYLSTFYRDGDNEFPVDHQKAEFHAELAEKFEKDSSI